MQRFKIIVLISSLLFIPLYVQANESENSHVEDADLFLLEELEYWEELPYDPFVEDDMLVDWEDWEDVPPIMERQATANIRFNRNWGTTNQVIAILVRPRNRALGSHPLPPRRTTGHLFVDWFTTNATSGGQRVRSNTLVPNVANWNLHARWTNPNRHNPQWWRPVNSGTTTVALRNFNANFNSTWTNPMNLAISGTNSWSRSTARVSFTTNSTSNNRVSIPRVNPSNPSGLGRIIYRERSGTNLTRFDIELFSETINNHVRNNANATFANVVQSIMAHELGHAVGLRDNPVGASGRNDSLMNHNRQRWVRRTPATFDVNSVNMIY